MANFVDSPLFSVYDHYYTPSWVWEKLIHLIPKDKVIWEACMLNATNSKSMEILKEFGYKVVGDTSWDFLDCEIPDCDIILTNIPFQKELKKSILSRLFTIGKPFIIIMNSCNIFANYFHELIDREHTQVIFPCGKLHYCKNGEVEQKNTSFYSVLLSYKMNLSNSQLFV